MDITLYSLYDYNNGDYNNGNLVSNTFDFEYITNEDEFADEIADWLHEITEQIDDGVIREEWMVADSDEIPDELVGEFGLSDEFWVFRKLLYDGDFNDAALYAAVEAGIDLDYMDAAYVGYFDSDMDFAEDMMEAMGEIEYGFLSNYIDWERVARDLMMDYTEVDGFYFNHNY